MKIAVVIARILLGLPGVLLRALGDGDGRHHYDCEHYAHDADCKTEDLS